jgi:hypothetical protein
MELELCPNCNIAVVLSSPNCKDHKAATFRRPTALPPRIVLHNGPAQKKGRLSLDEIAEHVAAVVNLKKAELRGPKLPIITAARQLFMYIAYMRFHYIQKEIAEYLVCATLSVNRQIRLAKTEFRSDRIKQQYYKQILASIEAPP